MTDHPEEPPATAPPTTSTFPRRPTVSEDGLERGLLIFSGLLVAMLLLLSFILPAARFIQVVPRAGRAPAFSLIDQLGRPTAETDLAGRAALFSFLALHGDPVAPETLASLARLRDELRRRGWLGEQVQLVTVSLDAAPPADLQALAVRWQATAGEWLWLTGSPGSVYALASGGFGVYYRRDTATAEQPLVHTSRYVLIDRQGRLRTVYPGPTLDTARVVRDLDLLQREAAAGGIAYYAYEAAHSLPFLCYPPQ